MATKIIFSATKSARFPFPLLEHARSLPLIRHVSDSSTKKDNKLQRKKNQEQRADDSLSDLIIFCHPLSKNIKTKKKQKRGSTKGFEALSLLQVKMNQTRGHPSMIKS